jgi:hypothetical protein
MLPYCFMLLVQFFVSALAFRSAPKKIQQSFPRYRIRQQVHRIFIDGEAGTTGLQVRERLAKRDDILLISPTHEMRKDAATRKKFINEADAVILCLPDDAAIEAASWIEPGNDRTIIIDASTAFRVNDGWTYGFPELSLAQKSAIAKSKRISNPGCYPTGFIGLIRPLVDAGIILPGTPLVVNAISGYSGGGKSLMEVYAAGDSEPWGAYGFGLVNDCRFVYKLIIFTSIRRNINILKKWRNTRALAKRHFFSLKWQHSPREWQVPICYLAASLPHLHDRL